MKAGASIGETRPKALELGYSLRTVTGTNTYLIVVKRDAFINHRESFPVACKCKFEVSDFCVGIQ